MDEYYFWLINTQFYTYTDQTDAQDGGDASFTGSYQFGFQDSYYDQYQQQSAEWNDEDQVPSLLAKWQPNPAVRLAWCRVHNGQFGQPRTSDGYVAVADEPDLVFLGRAGDSLYFQVSGSAPLPARLRRRHVAAGVPLRPPAGRRGRAAAGPRTAGAARHVPLSGRAARLPVLRLLRPGRPALPGVVVRRPRWPSLRRCGPTAASSVRCGGTGARSTRSSRTAPGCTVPTAQHQRTPATSGQQCRTAPQGCACCDSTKVTEQGARDRAVTAALLRDAARLGRRADAPTALARGVPAGAARSTTRSARITGQRPTTILCRRPGDRAGRHRLRPCLRRRSTRA